MSATATATRASSTLASIETVPVAAQPLAVVPEQPAPPQKSRLDRAWEGFLASPHGRAMRTWGKGIGAASGLCVPVALTAAAGYYVGDHNVYLASPWFGLGIGAVAGLAAIPAQIAENDCLIPTYERAGAPHPKWSAFLNVVGYMTLPALAGGMAISHLTNGGWGVVAMVVCGAIGTGLGFTAHYERLKDHPVR